MTTRYWIQRGLALVAAAVLTMTAGLARAEDKPPITIGFSIEQTGGLAAVGKTGLLAFQIWAEDINKKGGLLGRPIKLVFYDDQSNPANVPGIYTKLIEIDKVDLLISSYATNLIAPAMPIVIQKNRMFFGLFGLAVNSEFHYPKYFSMLVFGPDPKPTFSKGWFEIAMAQDPKPKTVALVTADAEFGRNALDGARQNVKAAGLATVYDRAYPPSTVDYTPIVRAVQSADAITATGGLDEDKLAAYIHAHPFKTIVGEISFGPDGEWTKPKNLFVQYHGVKSNDIEQFRDDSRIAILYPKEFKTGALISPYAKAKE
jgi:branched-chain amino acid transport system substrate-binding protein